MSLPRWMEPLLEAGEMREVDRWAITEKKIAVDQLMERAGEGLAAVVARRAPAGRIAIVCGKGNNGGDGIVAARLLRQAGRDVDVLLVWPPEWIGEDAQKQLKKLPGPAPVAFEAGRLNKAHVIVDCLLGHGQLGLAARARRQGDRGDGGGARAGDRGRRPVRRRRQHRRGRGPGRALRRHRRVPQAKVGLWVRPGKEYAGEVEVVDIGIPRGGPARRRPG